MQNVHVRRVAAPIERVRPWIEACWSGGVRDCFPRDVIPTWRRNPPGADPLALIPGETMVGHGPFRFRLRAWDGRTWRVELVGGTAGWHGFDLAPDGDGCRVTHTLELEGSLSAPALDGHCADPRLGRGGVVRSAGACARDRRGARADAAADVVGGGVGLAAARRRMQGRAA
jgi:hypothetical protein